MINRVGLLTAMLFTIGSAAEFKSIDECVASKRVANRRNEVGTITGVSNGMCKVRLDGTGKEITSMHWMLRPESDGAQAAADKYGAARAYSDVRAMSADPQVEARIRAD